MYKTDHIAVLMAHGPRRRGLRALLGTAGMASVGFDRTEELAAALERGRRFEMMVLSFEGTTTDAMIGLRQLQDLVDHQMPILLLMQPNQVEMAKCVMHNAHHDFLLGPYSISEAYQRAQQLYLTHVSLAKFADPGGLAQSNMAGMAGMAVAQAHQSGQREKQKWNTREP